MAAEIDHVGQAEVINQLRQNGVQVYRDWQEMLDKGGFDVVGVAAPLHLHRIMVITALQRGYPYSVKVGRSDRAGCRGHG